MIGRLRQWSARGLDAAQAWMDRRQARQWEHTPLTDRLLASPEEYRRRWDQARAVAWPDIDAYERDCGAAIDPDWFHALALLTQVTIKTSPLCYQHGRLLYARLRRYLREHPSASVTILETGTARGFSALCMARALADAGACGRILTFDRLPHDVPILWNCLADAEGPRTRRALLGAYADLLERYVVFLQGDTARVLSQVAMSRIHMAVFDSVHTESHVRLEARAIDGRQQPGDVLFFDDYSPESYPGVVAAADDICRRLGYGVRVLTAGVGRGYLIAEKA